MPHARTERDPEGISARGPLAVVTTLLADGSPHSTVVWIDCDGEDVLFNTARGRAKDGTSCATRA